MILKIHILTNLWNFPLSLQVGACIVNDENKIVGIGYNGMPNGCDDDLLPWSRSANDWLDTKYPYGENACTCTPCCVPPTAQNSIVFN